MKFKMIPFAILLMVHSATINAQKKDLKQENPTFRPYLIAIVVPNVVQSAEWYKENLNFTVEKKLDFPKYDSLRIVIMKRGDAELELIEKNNSVSIRDFVPDFDGFDKTLQMGYSKIAFWVRDARALADSMKAANVKILVNLYEDKDFGLRSFIISDPDGNVLQFNERLR